MGRLAASIGFAFGTGISAGISEKRKQDAEDKRSQELRTAAVKKIADAQQFQQDQLTEKRTFDANLKLQGEIKNSKDRKAALLGMGISGGDIDKILPEGEILSDIGFEAARAGLKETKLLEEKNLIEDRNIKFLDLFTKLTKEGTEGPDKGKGLSSKERTELAKIDPKRDPDKLFPPIKGKGGKLPVSKEEKAFDLQFDAYKVISKDINATPREVEVVRNETFRRLNEILTKDEVNNDDRFQRARNVLFDNFKDDSDDAVKIFLKNNPDFK